MNLTEQYKLAIELLEKESDRFWTRNNVLLVVQAAFITFYVSTVRGNLIYSILLSTQGFILAYIWIGILIKGARYVSRWDECVRELEKKIKSSGIKEFQGLKSLNDQAKMKERKLKFPVSIVDKRTTILIRYLIYSLLILWLVILIISIISCFIPNNELRDTDKFFHLLHYEC